MILDVHNVGFSHGIHTVLSGVSLSIREGELLAILGPNGVGKTTLLKCINGMHRPATGTIRLEGRDLRSMTPARIARGIGYVAQKSETARLTVYDAVLMGRKPHIRWRVTTKDARMVGAALAHLELEGLALRHIDQLSGGELQKVAVARALVQEPRLLLLDEPTSALDLKNQMALLTMIRRVVDEHRIGAVMTMHDLNAALRFADSFLFLKDHGVHAAGPCREMTAAMIEDVYGVAVDIHRLNGCPVVVPLR